ncbi:MAG TPA: hypothetical protein VMT36_03320, partial [Candidatus Saccharimonadia bacterium]|nr:hypothetical protein [Candidatus Saccharimonadia bacterium]
YDESAGIPICLEKSVRTANQTLRQARESHGLAAGAIGACVAVVRGHELYVATIGDADAYLVRQARLLTLPEDERGEGLPASGDVHVDVWRGEIAVGDSLLLVAGNVTRTVGTEEFKDALVTLHPQSAVEHIHHLFVATKGSGSDAILAIEASEVPATRVEHKLVPVRPAEPLAGSPERSPIPLADPIAGAAGAVGQRASDLKTGIGLAGATIVDRLLGLMPRRRPRYRRVTPLSSKRDSQRRAGFAALAFLGVVVALGVGLWLVGGAVPGRDGQITDVNAGDKALAEAQGRIGQVFDEGDLIAGDAVKAQRLLREAWTELDTAQRLGVATAALRPLRTKVADGLDRIYGARTVSSSVLVDLTTELSPKADIIDVVRGPDGAAYLLDKATKSIIRVDLATHSAKAVVKAGDGAGKGIGEPWQMTLGGPDILILDRDGVLWRWRPSDAKGRGTLAKLGLGGDNALGDDIRDTATYARNAESGLYFYYVVDPSSKQVLRYPPEADGSGYRPPADYLATPTDVSGYRALLVDGDAYALTSDGVTRFQSGRADDYALEIPPDDADVRPGHDYRQIAIDPLRREGGIWLWDSEHQRIVAMDKSSGNYVEQFLAAPGGPSFDDVRGMFVVGPTQADGPHVLIWADAGRLMATQLIDPSSLPTPSVSPSPSPSPSPTPKPTKKPKKTPKP